ncbi:NAD(P)-dependent alcohol dehydrogenase [Cellulomonas phragmiteti]|uniref:Dehydrogenase n=1 Tax=Cellulomonas phragmiteti TaxID=478780 RepID=A0ABQ4DMS8_9CELL|nr:NAD(P)-dependent alcohol dehydrogenase [Cellulomonas phragmiteti]GIG40659.1 dehydrogenase [Cellulomonas phragmiteti]
MRAVVVDRYGPPEVARVRDVPDPAPRAGEVLVRVAAAAVTSGDARMRAGRFPRGFAVPARVALGLRGPRRRVLGAVFSGDVVALGAGVTGVAVGDRVATMTGGSLGGHAELAVVRADRITPLPAGLPHDAAAAVLFGGATALDYLRTKAHLAAGATVLVNGASGAVGSSAVQVARHLGAEVTGVTSAANADLVTRLGATRVVDHRTTTLADVQARGERFDVVLDTVGNVSPAAGRRLLTRDGVVLLAVAGLGELLAARGPVKAGPASESPALLAEVLRLTADGVLDPLVESTHPLDGIADAYRRVDSGRKVGNVLVRPQGAP